MVVAALVQITNLTPMVFCNVINFALLRCVVRVLRAHSVDVIFSFEFKSPVQMSQLVTAFAHMHGCSLLNFKCLLVKNETIRTDNDPYLGLFSFSANQVYLRLRLNGRELPGHDFSISQCNHVCGLIR